MFVIFVGRRRSGPGGRAGYQTGMYGSSVVGRQEGIPGSRGSQESRNRLQQEPTYGGTKLYRGRQKLQVSCSVVSFILIFNALITLTKRFGTFSLK